MTIEKGGALGRRGWKYPASNHRVYHFFSTSGWEYALGRSLNTIY
jgi:hypothetical protein